MPTLKDAYKLMHEGALALSEVEAAGMRIDVDYLESTLESIQNEIKELESELRGMEEYKVQKKKYGASANLNSRQQLGYVLFEHYKHGSKSKTAKGKKQLDETALEAIGTDYVMLFLKVEKLRKLESTYLRGVLRETVDGYLHPFFNLHLVTSYRSSSDHPNFQNIPTRDSDMAEKIRSAFIPRDGHTLVEVDYSALEFRITSCFYPDPALISYASDPEKDIHRDCAAEIFMCDPQDVSKRMRYAGKNMFVFPEIYGDYYVNCAKASWEVAQDTKEEVNGTPLPEWIKSQGITGLGPCNPKYPPVPATFEWHMKKTENRFYKWFPEFSEQKEVWWNQYRKRGWFDLMTGFRCTGVFSRNQVFNYPIQGPAFHLLLWSLTQMVRWLKKNKMKTKIVGQIHDSIVADVHNSELDDYLQKAKQVMTEDVKKHWDWVVVPLEIEAEASDENWFKKETVAI